MQAIVKRLAENGQDTKSLADRANAAGVTVKAVEKAPEHAKEILSAYEKGATAEDVFKLMQGWGYTDWVRQERDRLTTYESLISTLANQYAAQMAAARQAQQFQMTSTTQQLQAIVDFVEKMVKEKKEQDQKETPQTQEKTAKKRKKKEEAEKLLSAIESGEKPAVTLFAKNKLYDEVERAQVAKDGLKVNELINNTKFQTIYEDHRAEELHGALKDLVPSKLGEVADVMKAGQGGQKVNLSKYDIAIQTALVVAYRKSLEEYRKQPN